MSKKIFAVVTVVVLLIVAGGAFYGGTVYGKSHPVMRQGAIKNGEIRPNIRSGAGMPNGANFISGDIISKDANSITLKMLSNEGSKIIFYSNTTQISKMASGTTNDLATGVSVSVTGTTNSDGSVTAKSIQIRPTGQNKPN